MIDSILFLCIVFRLETGVADVAINKQIETIDANCIRNVILGWKYHG